MEMALIPGLMPVALRATTEQRIENYVTRELVVRAWGGLNHSDQLDAVGHR
jgi:hypothetical protein